MHIALVSSHYPPNFVSGGTLVPQRIAEGFAARGHRVSVFAGSFEDGAAGHDRPARDLPRRRADPVDHHHRHADLGGRRQLRQRRRRCRVLPLAGPHPAGRGAFPQPAGHGWLADLHRSRHPVPSVLVTMHDMWWWCARQFLVDRDLRPCASVVDCGICPCERNNAWLVVRNRRLSAHLRNADLVLAPSSTMVDLLSANGIAPDRLALDENPSPDSVRHAAVRQPDHDGTVRFVFAGGKHLVKGVTVAVDAARTLGDLTGWSLDLYGAQVRNLPPGGAVAAALRFRRRQLDPVPVRRPADVVGDAGVVLAADQGGPGRGLRRDHRRQPRTGRGGEGPGERPGRRARRHRGVRRCDAPADHRPGSARAAAAAARIATAAQAGRPTGQPAAALHRADRTTTGRADRGGDGGCRGRRAATHPAAENPAPTVLSAGDLELEPIRRVLIVSGITGAPLRYRGLPGQGGPRVRRRARRRAHVPGRRGAAQGP